MAKFDTFSPTQVCATGSSADTDDLVFIVRVPQAPPDFRAEAIYSDTITWNDVQDEYNCELR